MRVGWTAPFQVKSSKPQRKVARWKARMSASTDSSVSRRRAHRVRHGGKEQNGQHYAKVIPPGILRLWEKK